MDLQLLHSFIALSDDRSFTKAAARQHLSQPAFSRRIQALEHWVGADLVDRSTYPVTLTDAGWQLRRRATALLEGLQEVRDEVRTQRQTPLGAIHVVTSHVLAFAFFPRWWRQVSGGPPLPCKLTAANTLDAYEALSGGESDLLLTYTDSVHPVELDPHKFEHITIGTDVFAPYAVSVDGKPKFRLPGSPHEPVPLVTYGERAFFGRVVDHIMRSAEVPCYTDVAIVTEHVPGLLALVTDGVGVAWLPGVAVHGSSARAGDLVRAGDNRWFRRLDLRVYRPRAPHDANPLTAAVWQRLRRAAARPATAPEEMIVPARAAGDALTPVSNGW